jgi:hypothetical protein
MTTSPQTCPEWPSFPHLPSGNSRFAAAQVHHGLGGIQLGFTIPPTLVTNDPAEACEFMDRSRV